MSTDADAYSHRTADPSGATSAARGSVRIESGRLLDLAVEGDADPVAPGQALTYRLQYGNRTTTTLAPGVTLRMVVPEGAQVRAAAEIADSGGRRTRATTETRVEAGVPFALTLNLNPDPAEPGANVAWQLGMVNTGAVPLLGVEVELVIPDAVASFLTTQTSGASASCVGDGNPASCVPRERLVWTVGTLASGGTAVLTMPATVRPTAPPGQVITCDAFVGDGSGFTAAARTSGRVTTP